MKTLPLLACVFAVTTFGCQSASNTETLTGHFVAYSPHMLNIAVDAPGNLNHQYMLPRNEHVKVIAAGGKPITLDKLQFNTPIKVTRNLETRQVTRIDVNQ